MTPGPYPDTSRHINIYGGRGMGGTGRDPTPRKKDPQVYIVIYGTLPNTAIHICNI